MASTSVNWGNSLDNSLPSIFGPTTISFDTPLGRVFLSGFLNMFGASVRKPWAALETMQIANEAQVHFAISMVFS